MKISVCQLNEYVCEENQREVHRVFVETVMRFHHPYRQTLWCETNNFHYRHFRSDFVPDPVCSFGAFGEKHDDSSQN